MGASKVQAGYLSASALQTSDGTDTEWASYGLGLNERSDGSTVWIDVRQYVRLSIEVTPGGSGVDITVNGRTHLDSGRDIALSAKTTYATGSTHSVLVAENIEGVGWIQVLEDGTDTEDQTIYILAK